MIQLDPVKIKAKRKSCEKIPQKVNIQESGSKENLSEISVIVLQYVT